MVVRSGFAFQASCVKLYSPLRSFRFTGQFNSRRRFQPPSTMADVIQPAKKHRSHWAFYSFRSSDWDGMDYELRTDKLSGKYWLGLEAGQSHDSLIQRRDNPPWQVLRREFRK